MAACVEGDSSLLVTRFVELTSLPSVEWYLNVENTQNSFVEEPFTVKIGVNRVHLLCECFLIGYS